MEHEQGSDIFTVGESSVTTFQIWQNSEAIQGKDFCRSVN